MKIAIMGSGNINVAFALDLIKAGNEMVIKERDSYSLEKMIDFIIIIICFFS